MDRRLEREMRKKTQISFYKTDSRGVTWELRETKEIKYLGIGRFIVAGKINDEIRTQIHGDL